MNSSIIFYHSRICMKCIRVRRLLNEIKTQYPEIKIIKVLSINKYIKRELKTIPAVKINNKMIYGKDITKNIILSELNLI
ncbi:MAG: glutaredoxin domain-containing protein [Candidatus Hodarchaeota archaeon]